MRKKLGIVVLIIFCFIEIRPLLPFLEYYANYDYIIEVLCINKETPMSSCNGMCYLSQELKEAQETENHDKKTPTVEFERIPMILYESELPKFLITISDVRQPRDFYQFAKKDLFFSPPTPPPKC